MAGMTNYEGIPTVVAAGEMTELVRGQEQDLVERIGALVQRESVALDLSGVERIDAAGIAALIRLYCDAQKAGHEFTVTRSRRHVREVLGLVGLERLLADANWLDSQLEETAA